MYKVKTTAKFRRSVRLANKRGFDISLLESVVQILKDGKSLDKKYEDHPLKGNKKNYRECHIKPDWLLIYLIENDILTLTLIDTGSHADLLDM